MRSSVLGCGRPYSGLPGEPGKTPWSAPLRPSHQHLGRRQELLARQVLAEAEWLDAELAGPVRLVTQHILKFAVGLLTGEEGLNRAILSVNEAPKVRLAGHAGDVRGGARF